MIAGTKVTVLGTEYIVPPFNIRMWERPELNTVVENESPGAMLKRLGPVVLENLARNYPDIDQAKIMDDLDLPTFVELRGAGMAMRHESPNPPSAPVAPPTGQG